MLVIASRSTLWAVVYGQFIEACGTPFVVPQWGCHRRSSSIKCKQAKRDQLKISCTDEKAKKFVEKFCGHVHWLVSVRHTYKILFEDEQLSCQALMEKTALSFFVDINRILQEYLLLESTKITDPATTRDDTNFTVNYLVEKIVWPDDKTILEGLKSLQDKTKDFRDHIILARNKLLAHLDTEAFLSGKALGGFPEGEDEKFFDALQEICNIAHEACFGTIYGEMSPVMPGGGNVIDLRRTLQEAVAFKEALSESSGQEETRLLLLFQKAGLE